jgi:hypothetical protein
VKIIEAFLREIDRQWEKEHYPKTVLRIIGSAALLLQMEYDRGTKDSDVLETPEITPPLKEKLLTLAGKGSPLSKTFRLYLDVVPSGIPFLPQEAIYHKMTRINPHLKHFEIEALDVADVVVSKLKRFNVNDVSDIAEMVARGFLIHGVLVARFRKAVDGFSIDARAEDLPLYVKNLHTVERDYFRRPASKIDLPDWV